MAEVIGTVSACIAIAETGLKVAKAIRERVHRSQTVRQEVSRITVILDSYQILLEALRAEARAEALDNDNVSTQSRLTALCAADGPLAACSEALKALENRLSHVSSGAVSFGKIIDNRTSAALSCLQEARLVLELALSSDQRTIAKNVHDALGTLQSHLDEIRSDTRHLFKTTAKVSIMVQAMMRQTDHGNRKKLLDDIFSGGNVVDRWRSNVSGVRTDSLWFFNSNSWTDWTSSPNGILWLVGPSGVGKTVLLSLAISKLQQMAPTNPGKQGILCAYFFFDFNMNDMQRPEYMARSLIQQLLASGPDPPTTQLLDRIHAQHFADASHPNFIQCRDILQSLIDALFTTNVKVFLVIDALDEAIDLADVFKYLPTLQRCHVILSSQELLCRQYAIADARMIAMNLDEITPDIQSYVEQRLENDPPLQRLSTERKDLIKKGIMDKSQGMFRLAQCQLDYISRLSDKRVVRLREVLQKLPNALNGIYQNHIDRIFDDEGRKLVLRLLFLLSRFRTLRVAEIAEYLAFTSITNGSNGPARKPEPDDLFDDEEVIELGGRFVRVTRSSDESAGLSLAHSTVATFLKDTYLRNAEPAAQVSAYCEHYFLLPLDLEELRKCIFQDTQQASDPKSLFMVERLAYGAYSVWWYLGANFPLHRLCNRALRRDRTTLTAPRLNLRALAGDEARRQPPLWYICYLATFLSAEPPGECLKYLLCFLPTASPEDMQTWTRGVVRHTADLLGTQLRGTRAQDTDSFPSTAQSQETISQLWPSEGDDIQQALGDNWRAITLHTRAYTLLVCYVECVVRFVEPGSSVSLLCLWGEAPSALQHTFTAAVRPKAADFGSRLRLTMLRRKLAQGLRQMLKDLKAAKDAAVDDGKEADDEVMIQHEEAVCEHILKWAGRGQDRFEWPDITAVSLK